MDHVIYIVWRSFERDLAGRDWRWQLWDTGYDGCIVVCGIHLADDLLSQKTIATMVAALDLIILDAEES